jgi:drug/metabolite transporter (DMT)-like permease
MSVIIWYNKTKRGDFMTTSFLILSISSVVLLNGIFNSVCKKHFKTNDDIYKFNIFVYAVCILIFGILTLNGSFSLYTVLLGVLFGVVTALSNLYKMLALSKGPMHITLLITTSSMIIPTLSGVFFGEKFSLFKILFVLILIYFIYLSIGKSKEGKINKSWGIYCLLAFILIGSIGIIQKIHQTSSHKSEISGFLFVSFFISLIISGLRVKDKKNFKDKKNLIPLAMICGVCTFTMNFLNLKLSGLLPSQLFFPLVNGSAIVLSSVMSAVLFKERLSKRQTVGLIGGILSLIGICIVP